MLIFNDTLMIKLHKNFVKTSDIFLREKIFFRETQPTSLPLMGTLMPFSQKMVVLSE